MAEPLSRREILRHGAIFGALILTEEACGKTPSPLSCTDTSRLSSAELTLRTTLGYSEQSTEVARQCRACLQFVAAPTEGQCGTCKIVKGPINPSGNCKSFVARPGYMSK
jgi:hypothetical protein